MTSTADSRLSGNLPAIPDARGVTVEQATALAAQIETWAATTEDVAALEDAQAKVAAIEQYLRRRHEAAATEMAKATRRLELRIGVLLGPPIAAHRPPAGVTPPRGSSGLATQRESQFRRMAAFAEDPDVARAVESGASRAEVLRAATKADLRAQIEERRDEIDAFNAKFGDFDEAAAADDVRQLGELRRLCRDLAALPNPAEFVAHHRFLKEAHITGAEAAYAWLDALITTWRNK